MFEFTFDGGELKAIVSAYNVIAGRFVLRFEEGKISAQVMNPDHKRLMSLELRPYGYPSYVEPFWVAGDMKLLSGAVKGLKKKEAIKCEVRDDGGFWVGRVQVGKKVIPEEELIEGEEYEVPSPRLEEVASLTVVVSGFKRMLRSAPADAKHVGFDVDGAGGHLLLLNERPSILDLRQDWRVSSRGSKRALYDLGMFTPLMVLGLSDAADIMLSVPGVASIKYEEADYTLTFYIAPLVPREGEDPIADALAAPRPTRTKIFVIREEGAKTLSKIIAAVDHLAEEATVTVPALGEAPLIHWDDVSLGVFRVSIASLDRWLPPSEAISGDFKASELKKHLAGGEVITLYEDHSEGKRRLVFVSEGPKIAPRELIGYEIIGEAKVPELVKVIGIGVFTGPTDLILHAIEDAQVAEDDYLIWYTTPYEIVAFGRNAVYYTAEFEADDFKVVSEEEIVPIKSEYFRALIGFLGNTPSLTSTIGYGAERDTDICLAAETDVGTLRTILPQQFPEAHKLVEEYRRGKERPPAPPEVKPLPEVAPPMPPPVAHETIYILADVPTFVGADHLTYGPFKAGEEAWMPKANADGLVREGRASWTKPAPPPVVAPPTPPLEEPSLGELYMKYYAEALARQRAEAAELPEEIRTVSRVEEPEAVEEAPAEVHIEEAIPIPQEELSQGDLYVKYYKEALARQAMKT
jgi:hypothetical protein